MSREAERNVKAAHAAIGAAIHVAGATMQISDLVGGILALAVVSNHATKSIRDMANDATARRIMVDLVQMVGVRRAHEIVDLAAAAGAGADFQ